uniref:FG41 Malonate Semialdehyde Decarboxylase n=1 Tax=coryneform bacterium TaxID=1728 RepID=F2Z288_9CORY|nr:Chain A, FG41 Malonate Semialdehyde Decarboxylase [coryneform bacterium]3MJZ_B Chain B, FG41 Malonate Semialdehyde Decarboxylase [coryneform bacterium]3MJZ_C Chain C, FG41 Malonate Semialdehyde Decarboxylase [coryneform bacterium]3MJZ_D Chain D, FG41 Malonate Semialdehyde Decarboxylase [coryneform bacterium]3MJZ_E Chain E, FG41 Malonate Semialdehyde Decarboxylase [coryneform bacterium]3MJZ_F Chain F, FG41 Malonate Semialdehyde Decarboxylase [coryneform bacterium]3MJZ_G Chain G, FG41 Malona
PLIRIDLTSDRSREQRRAIADAVHDALVEVLAIPARDRFQILTAHDPSDIIAEDAGLGFQRSPSVVIIHVFTQAGRTIETKQRVFAAITESLAPIGVAGSDVFIAITENAPHDWSFGFGSAQYVTGELAIPATGAA